MKILSFNIANAIGDEKTDLRFGNRLESVAKLIREQNPDIVCIQEIRKCTDVHGNLMDPYEISNRLAQLTGLSIAGLFMLNPSTLAFGRLTLYNSFTVFPLQNFGEWCSSTPHIPSGCSDITPKKFGTGVQYSLFVNVLDKESATIGENTIWVINTHYPLAQEDKLYTNVYMMNRIPQIVGSTNTIICGDFNTFTDGGDVQLAQLRSVFNEVSGHIVATFKTFPHDKYAIISGSLMESKLDHVFTYPRDKLFVKSCGVYDTSTTRESDHYLLITETI